MGLRGPAPEPTALKLHRGNPGKRPLNQWEPQPLPVAPTCPAHLDAEAKKEWRRLVKILMRMRVLTEADGMALASLCQARSTMVKAKQKLSETGILLKTPIGCVQQNPLISIVNSCTETVTRLSREFGLTPASRTRIHAGPKNGTPSRTRQLLELVESRRRGEF
jgi:P27 family predicted phage terminase small subunit